MNANSPLNIEVISPKIRRFLEIVLLYLLTRLQFVF
jgi:hypothetical protein